MRSGAIVLLVGLGVASCGQPAAGRSPKETVKNLEGALRSVDLGAVHDMLSARARKDVDASLAPVRGLLAAVPEGQLEGAGLAGWSRLDARSFLVAAAKRARKENPLAFRPLESATLVVMDVRQRGDRASVRLTMLLSGRSVEHTVPMVREGGAWRIDSDVVLRALPVDVTPQVPAACVTFS